MKTYSIPAGNIDALRAEIEKMNRRAKKLGKPDIELTDAGYTDVRDVDGKIYRTYQVQVAGLLPGIAGWRLVAVINHDAAKENIVKVLPGETLPESYRTAESWCGHCKTNRYRTDTFILGNAGELKQVGRNCLADFLREGDAESIAAYWENYLHILDVCDDAESEEFRGFRRADMWELESFLGSVHVCMRAFGWASASSAGSGRCTADDAMQKITHSGSKEFIEAIEDWLSANPWTEKDMVLVKSVIAWAKALGSENDYLYNLGVIARAEYITMKTYRLAASMIVAYQKVVERETKQRDAVSISKHFGTVGKRETFTLTLEKVMPLASEYGVTHLHIFHDSTGNRAVWFGSNPLGRIITDQGGAAFHAVADNATVEIKATVKAHEVRKGVPQTILTRCKLA